MNEGRGSMATFGKMKFLDNDRMKLPTDRLSDNYNWQFDGLSNGAINLPTNYWPAIFNSTIFDDSSDNFCMRPSFFPSFKSSFRFLSSEPDS